MFFVNEDDSSNDSIDLKKSIDDHEFSDYYDNNAEKNKDEIDEHTDQSKEHIKEFLSWIRDLGIVIIIALLITNFVGENTRVIGASMEPNIHDGDYFILDKISYRFSEPERFDIVVFPYTQDTSKNYIKRIIGLPGETIDIKDGLIYIDDQVLEESYGMEVIKYEGNQVYPLLIPENQYFVMGDNRNDSSDSRAKDVGTIAEDDIIGKIWIRIWPFNDFGFVE
jgi:signal peptidase I